MKKVRRGGRRNKSNKFFSTDSWSIYQSNIRGYGSKCVSLQNILSSMKPSPSLVVLNETHLRNGKKMKIPEYNSFNRNRQNKYMGGI